MHRMAGGERTRRVGANEAVFRKVNEQIEGLNRGIAQMTGGAMRIVCECDDLRCAEQIPVSVTAYERVRSDSALFFTVDGHEAPDVETIVDRRDGYLVVRKLPGEAQRVAAETDPRS